ncbi:MAG: hypothetical protein ABJ387_10160 [Balneola sp.]
MLRLLLYIFCGLLMIPACSDAPTKIERDNPDDPEAPTFSLDSSDNISTEILDNKVIRISWEDSVKFADYYILSKSLNNSGNYTILDTIDIQTKEYEDASGEINLRTQYLVYNERVQENGAIISSDSIYTGINFGNISYPDTSSYSSLNSDTTAINFTWGFETNWPFISLVYYSDLINNEPIIIDTLYNGTTSYLTPLFEKDFNDRNYFIRTYVSENDISNDIFIDEMAADYLPTQFYNISVDPIAIINENKTVISWNDNIDIETGFEILRSQKADDDFSNYKVIGSLEANETTFTDTLAPFDSYSISTKKEVKYAIRAFKDNSSITKYGYKAQIPRIYPTINITSLESDSFTLAWSSESSYIKEYILQISYDGTLFEDYKVFSKNTTSYTASSSDFPFPTFYFRIKTTTSSPSFRVGLSNSPELVEEGGFSFEGSRHFRFSESGNLIAFSRGTLFNPLDLGVWIYDLNNNSIVYSKDLLNASIHGLDINESKKRIAVASSTKRSVAVYDYEADTLIYSKNNFSVYDVHFSPDANSIYTNSTRGLFSKHDLLTNYTVFTLSEGVPTSLPNIRQLSVSPTGDSIAYNINGFLNLSDSAGNLIGFDNPTNIDDISQDVRFSTKGTYLSLANRVLGAYIYKAKTNSRYFEFDSRYVSINHNETLVLAGSSRELHLLDLENRKHIGTYLFDEIITNVAFSPKEDIVAIGTTSGIKIYSFSNTNTFKEIEGSFDLRYPNN